MNISIVIPAYNEEKRIKTTIKTIDSFCRKKFEKYEIIIVDDCSKDKTIKIVSGIKNKHLKLISNTKNKGKGYSVKKGMLSSKYELVLFSDADLATPIEELDKFLVYRNDFDVIIASRNMKESNILVKQSLFRQLIGKFFALLVKIITFTNFKDTQCGFKLFKTSAAKKIATKQTIDRFSFDVEQLIIARKLGYKIKEVPVKWVNDEDSKVNAGRDSIKMLFDLIKIRYKELKGDYNN